MSTQGSLHKYNAEKDEFTRIHISGFENRLIEIKTIFQDEKNNFWLGTYENGIFLTNKDVTTAISLKRDNTWNITLDANTLNDIELSGQYYWLATDNGVYVLTKDYKVHQHYTQESTNLALLSNKIRSIEEYTGSKFLIGTQNGLNIIDFHTGSISSHQSKSHPKALSENWIMDIYQDQTGAFWLGTYGKGVNVFNPVSTYFHHQLYNFENNMINAFTKTSDGKVWFSTDDAKLSYIDQTGEIKTSSLNIEDNIDHIAAGENNHIWLTSFSNTLYHINTQTKDITIHENWQRESSYNRAYPFIYNEGIIWFINKDNHLASYHRDSKQFYSYQTSTSDPLQGLSLENSDHLWLGSRGTTLFQFDIKKQKFSGKKIPINVAEPLSEIKTMAINKHWAWLASSQGVSLINRKNNQVSTFNEQNGLTNNYITAFLFDDNYNAWFATNRSISVINPYNKKIKNYATNYGLSDNEFIDNSALKVTNDFYFGGINGFNQFSPDKVLQISQKLSPPILTNFLVANKAIQTNLLVNTSEMEGAKRFDKLDSITLEHAQSPFSIEFISPNTKLPEQVRYQYRLKGLENNWIESGIGNRRATYTNLSSGNYTFEVQVYDIHQPQEVKTRAINIHILPPWWLSSSAIFIYTLIFLLIVIYFLQQLRHKRLYHLQIKQSEERLKLSLWGSGDEMWDWNIKTGRIYRSNIWGILDFPQDGRRNNDKNEDGSEKNNIHPQDKERVTVALEDHIDKMSDHFEATYRVKNKNNQWIWVLDRGKVVERDEGNIPTRMTGTLKDISQIKKAEENLKLFAKCIENISDAVVIYNRQFNVVDVNKAYQRITGNPKAGMLGKPMKFSRYSDQFTLNVKKHLLTKGSWHGEVESIRGDNNQYFTDLNIDIIRDEDNNISHFVGVFSDITKRKETEAELRKLASSDPLTGLPNRSYFQANQTRLVRGKVPHALLVFDLDNFKKINDSMGHEVGDVLLCKVAERILTIGRKQDSVYRLGGDEFSLIVENTNDIHTITSIAKEILRTIAQPFKLRNQEMVLYSSIGMVLYPEDGATSQELLKNADTAMYHAKDSGGNKYQFFSDSMNKKAVKRLQVENLIRHGLKEDLFSVFYQPKIEIATGKIAGMEALVRFETPNKGIISPLTFIPVSEETGQIIDIGESVLRKACFATKKWVDENLFDGRIAVNLSAVQFTQPNLVEMIKEILLESQLSAKYLELEITEGTVMDSPQQAIDTMLQIRKMGIHLSLDDFGTGYSSLAYLKKFPLNTLKIDKAFVDDIEHSEQGRNMVATIVTIAHNLDLHVVAEGVETNQQLNFLAGLRCEQLQGYLYSKPLPEGDFRKYLLSHHITDKSTSFGKY